MSKAYDDFLQAYNSAGKDKVERVYLTDFASMTTQELAIAEDMLSNDALKLDPIAIIGLGELKSPKAEKTLRSLISNMCFPSYIHLRTAESLWRITQDPVYQKSIIDNFDKNDDSLRRQAAIALEHTTPSQFTFNVFAEMIKTEKDSVMRTIAAQGILLFFGLLKSPSDHDNSNKYVPLRRLLKASTDEKTFADAITEVEKEAAKIRS